jgi:hypothetical protein
MTNPEAQRRAANFVHALDQYMGARDAVKDGAPVSVMNQTRAFLVLATATMLEERT